MSVIRVKKFLPKKECCDALQSMKNNKSPGNDGRRKSFMSAFLRKFLLT